jgi:hypothetical protein
VAGRVEVIVSPNTDPTALGCDPEAAGFPVCEAIVSWPPQGYRGLLGWVQLVGLRPPSRPDRRFQIDPLRLYEGLDIPFGFYGVEPTLFDAPSRRDRQQTLDWLAHSFLCVSPTLPMDRDVQAIAAFSWGFTMRGGEITIVAPQPLSLSAWDGHVVLLEREFPTWTFTPSTANPGARLSSRGRALGGDVSPSDDLLQRAETFADTEELNQFAIAIWRDPDLSVRFQERPSEALAEFGIKLPKGLDVVLLGTGRPGKPGPDFTPFEIRFSRCKTVVVRDPKTGRFHTEEVCFGIEIVPAKVPGGPIG